MDAIDKNRLIAEAFSQSQNTFRPRLDVQGDEVKPSEMWRPASAAKMQRRWRNLVNVSALERHALFRVTGGFVSFLNADFAPNGRMTELSSTGRLSTASERFATLSSPPYRFNPSSRPVQNVA